MKCRICRIRFDPDGSQVEGSKYCCDACRVVLSQIREKNFQDSFGIRPEGTRERVEEYRRRVEAGLPVFKE